VTQDMNIVNIVTQDMNTKYCDTGHEYKILRQDMNTKYCDTGHEYCEYCDTGHEYCEYCDTGHKYLETRKIMQKHKGLKQTT